MACRTGCKTQDHSTYNECLRDGATRVAYCGQGGGDATAQKKWDANLASYGDAVRQGIQPAGTRQWQIDKAVKDANKNGKPTKATPKAG